MTTSTDELRRRLTTLCILCQRDDVAVTHFTHVALEGAGEFLVYACQDCKAVPPSRARDMRDVYEPPKNLSRLLAQANG